jgi:WASH complex subunit 7
MVRMESNFSPKVGLGEVLGTRGNLLIQGVLLAFQVGNVGKLHLGMHLKMQTPIRKSNLRALLQSIELLKAIQHTYFRKSSLIAGQMLHIHRFLQTRLLQVLDPIATDLETQVSTGRKGGWKVDAAKLNMSTQATVLCDSLRGPNARKRRAVAQICWDMLHKKQIREGDVDEINLQLRKLEILGSLQQLLGVATDCSFLLTSRGLLPLFFAGMRVDWSHARQLPHLLAAVADAEDGLRAVGEGGLMPEGARAEFRDFVVGVLEDEIVAPLCQQIETDLRIHIHSNQIAQMKKSNPLKEGSSDLTAVLSLPPLLVLGTMVDIKEKVASYLDSTFYNLTTVTTHDWRTYEEMRTLAQDKYGVSLIETYLPTGSVEQGIDVLEIMRNIHVFVTRYHYHLHTQVLLT